MNWPEYEIFIKMEYQENIIFAYQVLIKKTHSKKGKKMLTKYFSQIFLTSNCNPKKYFSMPSVTTNF